MRKNLFALLVAGLAASAYSGSALAVDVSDTLDIEVEVTNECYISVQDYSGEISGRSVRYEQLRAGVVGVFCNLHTPYNIAMDNAGLHFGLAPSVGGETRRSLYDGVGEYLSYSIIQQEDPLLPWSSDGGHTVSGVGTGYFEQIPYGLVFYHPNLVSDGVYSDSVQVTLTYF